MLKPNQIASHAIRDTLRDLLDREISTTEVNRAFEKAGKEVIHRLRSDGYEVKGIYFDRED